MRGPVDGLAALGVAHTQPSVSTAALLRRCRGVPHDDRRRARGGTSEQARRSPLGQVPLGYYEAGYRFVVSGGKVAVVNGPRVLPLRRQATGDYVISEGAYVGLPVKLDRDADGIARIQLVELDETVRRTVGRAA